MKKSALDDINTIIIRFSRIRVKLFIECWQWFNLLHSLKLRNVTRIYMVDCLNL